MRPETSPGEEMIGSPSPPEWDIFLRWASGEGWRVPARELALYRNELADSAFVLRDAAGTPLGFVTVCRHQRSAWIGNLIVDPKRRGAGHGRRLFTHATAMLTTGGVATLWLTASESGAPLYVACGFRAVGRIERWVWRGNGGSAASTGPAARGELYPLAKADAAAWGDTRVGLLTLLARDGRILSSGSTVALLQPGNDDPHILGPWLSADLCPRSNRSVLAMALDAVDGAGEVVVDLLGGSPVRSLLSAAGFCRTGETVLMVRGEPGTVKSGEIVALASLGSMG